MNDITATSTITKQLRTNGGKNDGKKLHKIWVRVLQIEKIHVWVVYDKNS